MRFYTRAKNYAAPYPVFPILSFLTKPGKSAKFLPFLWHEFAIKCGRFTEMQNDL